MLNPRVREAAAQTHSCGGISDAGAGAEMLKLAAPQSNHATARAEVRRR